MLILVSLDFFNLGILFNLSIFARCREIMEHSKEKKNTKKSCNEHKPVWRLIGSAYLVFISHFYMSINST